MSEYLPTPTLLRILKAICEENDYANPFVEEKTSEEWSDDEIQSPLPFVPFRLIVASLLLSKALDSKPEAIRCIAKNRGLLIVSTIDPHLREPVVTIVEMLFKKKEQKRFNHRLSCVVEVEKSFRASGIAGRARNKLQVVVEASDRDVPPALKRIGTTLQFERLNGELFRETMTIRSGEQFQATVSDDVARRVSIDDLDALAAADQSPEEFLEVLNRHVAEQRQALLTGPRFNDLAGLDNAVVWGRDMTADFDDYAAGKLEWSDFDKRAVLVEGPPGTGKTAFAKTLAVEADVPLVQASVSDWLSGSYLSDALARMQNAFDLAISKAPAILFIDELDGITSREQERSSASSYWRAFVNRLLELAGDTKALEGVVIVAATNDSSKIDPAILRSGRISDRIQIEMPDAVARARIWAHYLVDAAEGIDFVALGEIFPNITGADIEHHVRQIKSNARRKRAPITLEFIKEELHGDDTLSEHEIHRMAIHEAGHAVVAMQMGHQVNHITLSSRSTYVNCKGSDVVDPDEIDARITIALAGRVAESVVFGSISAGSGGTSTNCDLAVATGWAYSAETLFAFGEGVLYTRPGDPFVSEQRKVEIEGWVKSRLTAGEQRALEIVKANIEPIKTIAKALAKDRYLNADQIKLMIGHDNNKDARSSLTVVKSASV